MLGPAWGQGEERRGCLGWAQGCAPPLSCDPGRKDGQSLAFSLPGGSRGWGAALGTCQRSCLPTASRGRQRGASVCLGAGDGAEPARLPQSAEEGGVGVDLGSLCRPRP